MSKHIGQKIKAFRESKGITQKELGKRIGTTRENIHYIEKRVDILYSTLSRVAKAFKVTPEEILK